MDLIGSSINWTTGSSQFWMEQTDLFRFKNEVNKSVSGKGGFHDGSMGFVSLRLNLYTESRVYQKKE